jgi:hypothetical protein
MPEEQLLEYEKLPMGLIKSTEHTKAIMLLK